MLWQVNGGDQYRDLQTRVFQVITAAFESLTPLAVLEAICFDPDEPDQNETLDLDQIESLYSGFLKLNSKGFLEYEHLSAKMFVNGIKECSVAESHRMMANIGIAAIKRHSHQMWVDARVDLAGWAAQLHRPLIARAQDPNAKVNFNIERDIRDGRCGAYLFRCWLRHCQTQCADDRFVQQMSDLFQGGHLGLESWIIIKAWGYYGEDRRTVTFPCRNTLTRQADNSAEILHPNPFLCMASFGFSPFSRDIDSTLSLLPGLVDDKPRNLAQQTALHVASYVENKAIIEVLLEWERQTQGSCLALLSSEDSSGKIAAYNVIEEDTIELFLRYERLDLPAPSPESNRLVSRMISWQPSWYNNSAGGPWAGMILTVCSHDFFSKILQQYEVGSLDQLLCEAVSRGKDPQTVELLLQHGANPNAKDVYGRRDNIYAAIFFNSVALAALLLDYGAILEPSDDRERRELEEALSNAAKKFKGTGMMDLLFSRGAGLNLNAFGIEALGFAADKGHIEKAQFLLDKGVDINAKQEGMETPLERATLRGKRKMAGFLMEGGANVDLLSKEAKSDLDQLLTHRDEEDESEEDDWWG